MPTVCDNMSIEVTVDNKVLVSTDARTVLISYSCGASVLQLRCA